MTVPHAHQPDGGGTTRAPGREIPPVAAPPRAAAPVAAKAGARVGQSVVRAGALSMLALVAVGGTRLVHGSLASRATDRATYGLIGIMLAASMVASLLLPGGLSSAIAKFVAFHRGAGDPATAWAVHRFLSRAGVAASLVLGAATAVVVQRVHDLGAVDTVSLAVLTTTYSVYTLDKAALYGHGLVPQYARIELGSSLLAVAATVAVVATGEGAWLVPLCLGYGVFVVLGRRQLRLRRRAEGGPGGGRFHRREIVTFAVLGSVGTLASAGFLQGTQLLAGQFTDPSEVAYLVAAVALIAPLYFLPRALALALFPAMAGAQGAGDLSAVRRQVDVSTLALAVTMTPVFLLGLLAAPLVLGLFGGSGYAEGAEVLRLMLCAAFFGILQVPSVNALASGPPAQARTPVVSAVVGCLVGLGVIWLTAGSMGASGVALGYLVGTVVTATIPVVAAGRIHRLAWGPLLFRCVGLLVVGVLVARLDALRSLSWPAAAAAVGVLVLAGLVLRRDLDRLRDAARAHRSSGRAPAPETA
ncbi:lipopolysaccharide biosynthesis protein [Micromonospora phytophila]|uniref:lipopolysaccharide biosynthesis protein n=1 Tax=Micromonospora phytophila TaxID=709888 RepID=UPI00202DBE3B|nr:lipopolysaccharide biosynthesis protein [Micromonospora phytophila]MCM0675198.1 lipopolysaccharide biosynthesis protein [Micromonospora phytophila]